ncbi:alpha/beta fold hydrolase [Namhaeicola litoreus]|uniref:Alpha/beta fold hydrolase n=1 Tax=Namhaeicola litoreus TaxID=1052145 RepID=A0ABW3Y3P0_9FLAO
MPNKGRIRRWIKGIIISIGVLFIVALFLVFQFLKPKSDKKIIEDFNSSNSNVFISYLNYDGYKIRILQMNEELDSTKQTLLFVHGSPGSALDFKKYLADSELNHRFNLVTYDRPGYGKSQDQDVLNDLKKETSLIHYLIKSKALKKVNLVGYSYGGTITAALNGSVKKKILLAPALKGELEPMFWILGFYNWKPTRNLIPVVFKHAAEEKLHHVDELPLFEDIWGLDNASFLLIHGIEDDIVPYQNSVFLKDKLGDERVKLITLSDTGHALLWTNFDLIKKEIINFIDEN